MYLISFYDGTNKILSSSSNYIVDVAMLPNFVWFSIFMREVIITQIFYGFEQKNRFFFIVGLGSSSIIWDSY